jgi:Protein of unknown function (DUF3435)
MAEDVRSQAIGHINGFIYERHYRNQVVDINIVSAFLKTPLDEALMKLIGYISLIKDPNALAKLSPVQRR